MKALTFTLGIEQLPKLEAYGHCIQHGRAIPPPFTTWSFDSTKRPIGIWVANWYFGNVGDWRWRKRCSCACWPLRTNEKRTSSHRFRALKRWLEQVGFEDVRIVDEKCYDGWRTTCTTEWWMTHNSLPDYLDPNDPSKTSERSPSAETCRLL